jgi:hypothetical protein
MYRETNEKTSDCDATDRLAQVLKLLQYQQDIVAEQFPFRLKRKNEQTGVHSNNEGIIVDEVHDKIPRHRSGFCDYQKIPIS